jgi:hypothetical protein
MENNKNEEKYIDEPELITEDKPVEFGSLWMGIFFFIVIFVATLVAYMGNVNFNIFNAQNLKKPNTEIINVENNTKNDVSAFNKQELFEFTMTKVAFAKNLSSTEMIMPALSNTKANFNEIINREAFKEIGVEFSEDQIKALEESGFFLMENELTGNQEWGVDDFADVYKNFSGSTNMYNRKPHEALYISSDVALHLYHLLIDRSFQRIEEQKFQPMLRAMSESLFVDSINKYNTALTQEEKDTYKRLSVFYLIPLVVLDTASLTDIKLEPADFETYAMFMEAEQKALENAGQADFVFSLDEKKYAGLDLADEIYNLAKAELDLIREAKTVTDSPLFTPLREYFQNDYTQFKPRSHYTKNSILKSYFIAMMWYGRMGFSLDSPDLTRDAITITGQVNTLMVGEEKLADMYNKISTAVEFFVGEVDDLTPYEYTAMIKKIYDESMDTGEFNDDAILAKFIKAAISELPKPRIVSEAVELYDNGGERDKLLMQLMQFRFMGQRFTPDAYVINNLTQGVGAPDPETGQNLPSMTTALMPIYVIQGASNELVKNYIDKWVTNNASDSDRIIDKKLAELNREFSSYPDNTWTQNIYWSWLNTYRSLLGAYQNGYPYFMTTDNWQKKNLGTVLGSYTELKHDTLLYAKQSYAELGGGGDNPDEIPPVPMGYVEADYTFWNRLVNLSEMTANGLKARDLMPEGYLNRYNQLNEYLAFYQDIAKKELTNEIISEEDFEKLRKSGHVFQNLSNALPGEELTPKDRRAGIIADIHTDAVRGEILYEATGKPYLIYVAVKDSNGVRLTRGLVYNHYELIGPLAERYADEDWQKIVYDGIGELPAADEWSRDLVR